MKKIIYKFVFYLLNNDKNLAFESGKRIFIEEQVKRYLICLDIHNNSCFWLNLFETNLELGMLAQNWLMREEDCQKKVVSYLYENNLLANEIEKYMLMDVLLARELIRFYFNEKKEDIREVGFRRDIFRQLVKSEIIGGTSLCKYSEKEKLFQVTGWFLPCCNYDKVEISICNKIIGDAVLRIRRMDIFQDYPFANEKYAGWQFQISDLHIMDQQKILISVYKNKMLIFRMEQKVEFVESEHLIPWDKKKCSRNEKIYIYKDKRLMEEIDISGGKEFLNSFRYLNDYIRKDKGNGWTLLQKIGNKDSEFEILEDRNGLITKGERKELEELLKYCKKEGFYEKYIINYNFMRVRADVDLLGCYVNKKAAILDIGAVPPILEQYLLRMGYENLTVWDPNVNDFYDFFHEYNIKSNTVNISLDEEESTKDKYDLVIFSEVLEHLTGDIGAVIGKLRKCIKTGGYLYITTPNLESISGLYSIFCNGIALASKSRDTVYAQYERVKENGYYGHVREYTDKEVIRLMYDFGFDIVKGIKMPEFRDENILVYNLERIYPAYGLFGKYLFKKIDLNKKE